MTKSVLIKERFERQSLMARIWAWVSLVMAVGILVTGFVEVLISINDFQVSKKCGTENYVARDTVAKKDSAIAGTKQTDSQPADAKKEISQLDTLSNLVARAVLLSFIFFFAQLFMRIYKYNLGLAAVYQIRVDALDLADQLKGDPVKLNAVVALLGALGSSKADFEAPESPKSDDIVKPPDEKGG